MTKTQFQSQFKNLNISDKNLVFVSSDYIENKSEELNGKPSTYWKEAAKTFFTNKWTVAAFSVFVLIVLLAIIVPAVSPYQFNVNVSQEILSSYHKPTEFISTDFYNLPVRFPGLFSGAEVRNLNSADFEKFKDMGLISGVIHFPQSSDPHMGGTPWPGNRTFVYRVDLNLYKNPVLANHHFILGTDSLGSDRWTNLWDSAAFSLKLAFLSTFIMFLFGVTLGAASGYYAGRAFDSIVQRIVDIIGGLPVLIWWMIVVSFFSNPGFLPILTALIITGWIGPAFWTRAFVITYKDSEFIKAADTYGASTFRKIAMHIMPSVTGRLAASFVQRIPYVIYAEASLAILGIGISKTSPGLGTMISNGRSSYLNYPIDMNAPIILIIFLVLSLQIMAIGIRDALDPKISAKKA